jgi:L-alanine-DL-glutamate epimerase-like enolase superfamily enzyme
MSRVVKFESWVCRKPGGEKPGGLPDQYASFGDQVILVKLTTDDGVEGISTVIAATGTAIPRANLDDVIAPVVLGREVHDREAIWQDLYLLNRRFGFFPMYLPGPVDVALWDIAAKEANLPLFKYLGAYRDAVPAYASGQFMPEVGDYVREALHYQSIGVPGYKIHPSGDWRNHIRIAEAVRDAVPEMVLMLDPALSDYTLTNAMTIGRQLERLNFYWFEEPFHDIYIGKYVELTRALDISICATEASYGGPAGVAEFIRCGAADIVRADVSWKWGVTGSIKTLHLAEAFGLNCELHTTCMGPTDIANLHVACAAKNCEFFELFAPHDKWTFPMLDSFDLDEHGLLHVPTTPGIGVKIDWDVVDEGTLVKHELR